MSIREVTPDDLAMRHVAFDGCFNFRDVGGYETRDGCTVRWGRLFRSGALHRMTAGDVARATSLGIRSVIDLRRPDEVDAAGGLGPFAGRVARHYPLPVIPDGGSAILDERYGPGISGPRYVGYLDFAGPRLVEGFELLAGEESLPAVVHCSAGKDRTGTFIAMVLDLLGVPRDVIVRDYLLTNLEVERQVRFLAASNAIREDGAREGAATVDHQRDLRRELGVPAQAIEIFLDHLAAQHGSVEGYLRSIGVADGTLERLKGLLLEPDVRNK